MNKYRPHIYILPEDEADNDFVVGFLNLPIFDNTRIAPLRYGGEYGGGWLKAVEKFKNDHIPDMNKFPGRYMILVIDFDKYDDRAEKIQNFDIPDTLRDRVFIIGSRTNPQSLKKELKMNGEEIGEAIARSCAEKTGTIWDHPLLKHNQAEIDRLRPVIEQFRL